MAVILIVDDRPANREFLITLLRYGGHRLLEATDGAEGLAITRTERPNLVIADILMPTMDGYEFVRLLRADPVIADTRVIFYTAHYHEPEARKLAAACGVFDVLIKPCEPEVVLRTVEAALGHLSSVGVPASSSHGFDREHLQLLTDKLSEKADELRRANERLTAMVQLGLQLGSERDQHQLLQVFCDAAREIVGSRYALVGIPNGAEMAFRYFLTSGMDIATAASVGRTERPAGVLGSVLAAGRCFRAANHGDLSKTGLPTSFPPCRAVLGAPILSPARVHGWICLLDKLGGDAFTEEDERLAGILAAQVGRIYENGSLYDDLIKHASKLAEEAYERKRGESALRESEGRFRGAFDDTGVAMVLTDLDNRFIRVNAAFAWMFGYTPPEMIGMTMAGVTHPDDIGYSYALREQLLAGKEHYFQMEKRYLHREGHTFWGLTNVSLIRDSDGQPLQYVGQVQDITERKRAEADLRRTGELLRAVVEGTTDAVFVKDREGKYLLFNEAAARFVGKPVAEVLGKDDSALFDPESAERIRERDRRVMASGLTDTEEETLTADGVTRTYLATKGPYRDDKGNVAGVLGISRDITDRKRTEQRLRAQHAVDGILAQSPDLQEAAPRLLEAICETTGWEVGDFWVVDRQANALFCVDLWSIENSDVAEFRELSRQSTFTHGVGLPGRIWASGKPAWIVDIAKDPNFPRAEAAAAAGLLSGFGFPIPFGNEVLGVAEFFSRESRQPDEGLLRLFTSLASQIGQYIERKRVEGGLRLFRALIDQTMDGIEVIDPVTGRFLDVNERICITHGYTREEYLKLSVRDVDSLVGSKPWDELIAQRRLAEVRTFESQHRRKDGSTFPVEINLNFISLDHDYMVGVVRDITERKHLEDQFRQAQKMEAVGRLAGGVAHDFNNLLTVINGYSELVFGGLPTGDPKREMVREVINAGERAAALTRQLLAFSRKAIIEPKVLDLKSLVADVERMLRRIIGEDIQLTVVADPGAGAVKADPGQIEQVILNLVVNARDALPTGGRITIEVGNSELDEGYARTHPEARPGSYVLLAVTDTGCGMDAATIARVFEPFFTTKGEHGTGLGLATVHGIVKQAGGHVAAYSEVGRGTTFKVYLPRVERDSIASTSRPAQILMPMGDETVLLVEDEDGVRALTRQVLANRGYRVLEARDGHEALQLATDYRGRIELLLTDVVMPRMGGRELSEKLADLHPGIKVLFLSGYTDDAVVRHGILEAEVAFLQKPFTPASLAAKVRAILDGK